MKLIATVLLSLSLCLSVQAETSQTKLISHKVFGKIPRDQTHLFEQFEPYVDKAIDMAALLGVYELPSLFASFRQETTAFSKRNSSPHYMFQSQKLLLGSVVDKSKLHKAEIAIALHEIFHAVHMKYLMQAHGAEFPSLLVDQNFVAYVSTSQTGEFFADLLTTLVMDDANVIVNSLDFYLEQRLNYDLSEKPKSAKINMDLRDFDYNETEGEHSCSSELPTDSHYYYSILRKYVWNDLYKGHYNSSKDSISKIINAIAEVGVEIGLRDQKLFNDNYEPFLSAKMNLTLLTRPSRSSLLDTTEYLTEHYINDSSYIYAVEEKLNVNIYNQTLLTVR